MQSLIPLWGGTRDSEFPTRFPEMPILVVAWTVLERQGSGGNKSITCPAINPGELYYYEISIHEETNYFQSFV